MRHLLLTFDLEEFVFPYENNINFSKKKAYEISEYGLKKIMVFLEKWKIKSTFFTTFEFAKRFPKAIEYIISENHELAFHGKEHKDYSKITFNKVEIELKICKVSLEKKFNVKINGFRAPRLRQVDYKILENTSFYYDTSIHPTIIPLNKKSFSKKIIYRTGKIIEIPVSVNSLRLPVSWIFFRLLPLNYSISSTKDILNHSEYIMLYFHPWDFFDLEKIKFNNVYWNIYNRNSGEKLLNKLDNYMKFIDKEKLKKSTIISYLKSKTI